MKKGRRKKIEIQKQGEKMDRTKKERRERRREKEKQVRGRTGERKQMNGEREKAKDERLGKHGEEGKKGEAGRFMTGERHRQVMSGRKGGRESGKKKKMIGTNR